MQLTFIPCPRCGRPAQVVDRRLVERPEGRTEQLEILCTTGHWLAAPASEVGIAPAPAAEPHGQLAMPAL